MQHKKFLFPNFLVVFLSLFLLSSAFAKNAPEKTSQKGRLHLNLVWHLSQTDFLDGLHVQLGTPEVRHNATSVYFSLLSQLQNYPKLHTTLSLPGETLRALQRYVVRLREFADLKKNQFDYNGYLKKYGGQTDPWLDMLLVPSAEFHHEWDNLLLGNSGRQMVHAFALSPELLKRFPEYVDLMPSDMRVGDVQGKNIQQFISVHDKMKIKFFFAISHFDEAFLREKIELPLKGENGQPLSVQLNDYFLVYDNLTPDDDSDDYFVLAGPIGEDDCQKLVFETYKVMESVLILIEQLAQNEKENERLTNFYRYKRSAKPSVSLITSPQNNALIPLLFDSQSALNAADSLNMPLQFSHPEDAEVHILRAVENQKNTFHVEPKGFFPTCGALSSASMRVYDPHAFRWLLTGKNALPEENTESLVRFADETAAKNSPTWILAETDFSLRFNATYSRRTPDENLDEFVSFLNAQRSPSGDQLLTLIFPIDRRLGYFNSDFRAHKFFKSLLAYLSDAQAKTYRNFYRRSRKASEKLSLLTCTPSEYLDGAKARRIASHEPAKTSAPAFGMLTTGGITQFLGDEEEKIAWSYLSLVRGDFAKVGLSTPPSEIEPPAPEISPSTYFEFLAWESIFAAENALWFQHFGNELGLSRRDIESFDQSFRLHLENVYLAFEKAGHRIERRKLLPVVTQKSRKPRRDFAVSRIKIDGLLDEDMWYEDAGIWVCEGATEDFRVRRCLYGLNEENLFLALDGMGADFDELLRQKNVKFTVTLFYDDDGKTTLNFQASKNSEKRFLFSSSQNSLEMQIPFSLLDEFESNSGILGTLLRRQKIFSREMELGLQIELEANGRKLKWPEADHAVLNESAVERIDVIFEVDVTEVREIPTAIYICGDQAPLGNWAPNTIRLFDNGASGDRVGNDKIWSRKFRLREGQTVTYKYTNSGAPGTWEAQELGKEVRRVIIEPDMGTPNQMIVRDIYDVKMR